MVGIRVAVIGDVHINRDDPENAFSRVQPYLDEADLRICQLEATMSEKGTLRSDVQNPSHRVPPEMVEGFKNANIDLITFAGNNQLDYGPEALFDTTRLLEENGIKHVGVGENIEDAWEPEYIETENGTVGVFNVCSILRSGYEATDSSPGLSPLHVSTFYETLENRYEQPSTPSRTVSVPRFDELQAVLSRIHEVDRNADYTLAAFHWGVHFTYDLANYQPAVAYQAVEAGADAVIGTHPHNLQAVDVHQGKPIFYSMGNFIFDQPEEYASTGVSKYLEYYGMSTDSGARNYPHPRHTRDTMLAYLDLEGDDVAATLLPVKIKEDATPERVDLSDSEGKHIFDLLRTLSAEIGTELEEDGNEISVPEANGTDARAALENRRMSYPWLEKLRLAEYSDNELSMDDFF